MADINQVIDQLLSGGASSEEIVSALVGRVGGPNAARKLIEKTRLAGTMDKFAGVLRDGAVALKVKNWPAIEAFRDRPETPDSAVSLVLDDVRTEILDAIEAKDEERLIVGLMLLWKAVKR